jgi:hypothetical protein
MCSVYEGCVRGRWLLTAQQTRIVRVGVVGHDQTVKARDSIEPLQPSSARGCRESRCVVGLRVNPVPTPSQKLVANAKATLSPRPPLPSPGLLLESRAWGALIHARLGATTTRRFLSFLVLIETTDIYAVLPW